MGIFLFRHDFLLFFKALHLTIIELKAEFRFKVNLNLSRWLTGKGSTCQAGDVASVPGSGGSPGKENANPFQYSCLGNPMDRGGWWATAHGVTKELDRT